MKDRYFTTARTEIAPYLPKRLERVLELGPGQGSTLAWIKQTHPDVWAYGVELFDEAAVEARHVFQEVRVGNVETLPFEQDMEPASLDLVLCLDVLEHLVDPWAVVNRLSPLLRPGGRLLVSVPNIRNWKFLWRLLTKADFHYTDAGLLDRTHLRFFVRDTAAALAKAGGLEVRGVHPARPFAFPEAKWWLTRLGLIPEGLLAKQWIVVAERAER